MERQYSQPSRSRRNERDPQGNDQRSEFRGEVDGLLNAADRIFDSINNIHAQQYLEQNLQTGGQ